MGAGRDRTRWQRIAVSGQPIAVSAVSSRLPVVAFPPTGIYRQMGYYRHVPRSFAALRMTVGGGKADV